MKVFISGGSGSLGRAIARKLQYEDRVVIFSRTEGRQMEMAAEIPEGGPRGIRYFLGDIADYERLKMAMKGTEVVIHCAAMKCIDSCTYNPTESIKTNIIGTENIARACIELGIKQAIFISSDKAADAISMYGAQKFIGEQIFISFNNYGTTHFNACRYGNVVGSNKSVFHAWEKQSINGEEITVAHSDLTRFFWSIDEAANFVIDKITDEECAADRGVIYIPKMRSFRMMDIALSYSPNIQITGLRCPEKIDEILLSKTERLNTYCRKDYYVIHPMMHSWNNKEINKGHKVSNDLSFSSSTTSNWDKNDFQKTFKN